MSETHVDPMWVQVSYLVAAVLFILALKSMSSPRTARTGVLIGAIGAALATGVLFFSGIKLANLALIVGFLVVGSVLGLVAARRVKMTAMPQLVALFNGVGGGAAALIAVVEYLVVDSDDLLFLIFTVATVIVGSIAFSGSIVTYLKLQELMTTRPVVIPLGKWITILVAVATVVGGVWLIVQPQEWLLWALLGLSLVFGVLFVLPVGGADVPIVISLLNAMTGLAVAASGYVLGNVLLLIAGTLVGASGTLLTNLMAKAMGRPLTSTLFGAFSGTTAGGAGSGTDRPVRSGSANDVAIMLGFAGKVILVPGYGLAVAQAQSTLRELADLLAEKGIEVDYAIHPVAGRMPGHMNVLLAEANVPYEQLKEMDEINPEFSATDVVLVVGANDVVNPAARTDQTAPIYGMPILDVDAAQQIVFLKRSMRPGFAGIENEILFDPKTTLLFGDAKDSLTKVVAALKNV
ncbi:MAG: NAD(P)(+) transhydrogenase (Re/Si-specific) subunit beta [Actinomycetota bacterium]|nr:NAD(P) transhydrogenase subunit beta [Micrococcales bacterium]MEC7102135.1 NAD(P)(+) transhydrogenase (Re/Si-specific) subunit beta [Actinomycetota bacterium]MEC7103041.1 NAD(P)(+) transhydrogenase (Re/Si-specific) subunit beta [Actinomycetota bacterium]MEC8445107.1 NAD(P)(+) transhydrogenase (Re/Si-specific) subunit beta [Actinomycetota bacterium]MEC8504832.1 NAD(P)(+) transhydrogenase (Re/Si-specific) subunit beta [Actinomycetota bacterium]|tara:strand:- start:1422 stop:2810 length:1389 start_codon:yes stop_codon:yes gene_type:complete